MEKEFSELDGLLEYLGCGKYPVTTTQAPPGTTTPATSTTTPGCTVVHMGTIGLLNPTHLEFELISASAL